MTLGEAGNSEHLRQLGKIMPTEQSFASPPNLAHQRYHDRRIQVQASIHQYPATLLDPKHLNS